jgi:hypothetical protein
MSAKIHWTTYHETESGKRFFHIWRQNGTAISQQVKFEICEDENPTTPEHATGAPSLKELADRVAALEANMAWRGPNG